MFKYNPKDIHNLATTLIMAATVTLFVAAVVGIFMVIVGILGASFGGGRIQVVSVLLGIVFGGAIFFVGYLLSLLFRGKAHLMLAILEIEANTASSSPMAGEHSKPEQLETIKQMQIKSLESESPTIAQDPPDPTDKELMEKYSITFDGEQYQYRSYRYKRLIDAVNYAKMKTED